MQTMKQKKVGDGGYIVTVPTNVGEYLKKKN
jgi:hypothetical protein